MTTIVLLGGQWGDEGKGKLADILSADVQFCCRAQGGNNAGHTIHVRGTTYNVHLLPSGLVNPSCINLIGSGCVVHVPSFFAELEELQKQGLDTKDRIFISDRAHVVFDLHQLVDGLQEVELGTASIGTTNKGIGPTYSTKATRSGVRITDLFDKDQRFRLNVLEEKLGRLAHDFQRRYGDLLKYDIEEELSKFKIYGDKLKPFVVDQVPLLRSAKAANSTILVEGANGVLLDLDHGTYPFCTSSNSGLGGILTGLTVGWSSIKEVIAVVKAYTTRVGAGVFPTEQLNEVGEKLQTVGHEYGVTTGRRRRCGWLDLVIVKYSADVNDYTAINLTKLDILDTFPTIRVATAYTLHDQTLASFPANLDVLANIDVTYETLPGWQQSTAGIKTWDELPANARKYVEFIERFVGVRVRYIGTGPGRESMIFR